MINYGEACMTSELIPTKLGLAFCFKQWYVS